MNEIEKIILESSIKGKIIDDDINSVFIILNDLYALEAYLKNVKILKSQITQMLSIQKPKGVFILIIMLCYLM